MLCGIQVYIARNKRNFNKTGTTLIKSIHAVEEVIDAPKSAFPTDSKISRTVLKTVETLKSRIINTIISSAIPRLFKKPGRLPSGKARLTFTITFSNTFEPDQSREMIATIVTGPRILRTVVIWALTASAETGIHCIMRFRSFNLTTSPSRNIEPMETAANSIGKMEKRP